MRANLRRGHAAAWPLLLLALAALAEGCGSSSGSGAPLAADGQACLAATDCASGHCANGFCCTSGTCCATAADCPAGFWQASACTDASAATTCQGTRLDADCLASACVSATVPDDSGCLGAARGCGAYAGIACSGAVDQPVAACASNCTGPADCSPGNTCEGGACAPMSGLGLACTGTGQGSCQPGLSCVDGVCCGTACGGTCQACAAALTGGTDGVCGPILAGVADQAPAGQCSGSRACFGGACLRVDGQPCGANAECGNTCLGGTCALRSGVNGACDAGDGADCAAGLSCVGGTCKRVDGQACAAPGECASGHCGNGFCCLAGACCGTAADCPASYTQASGCTDPVAATNTCQGTRLEAACTGSVCGSVVVADASGCAGMERDCGTYAAVACTGAVIQPVAACGVTCAVAGDCSPGHECVGGACVLLAGVGQACTGGPGQGTCGVGLKCENGVCCDGAGGTCCTGSGQCPNGLSCDLATSSCWTTCNDLDSSRCATPTDHCSANACVPKHALGTACLGALDCASGHCVDGVCCDSACNQGACAACNLPGREGTCGMPADDVVCGTIDCQGILPDLPCMAFLDITDARCDTLGVCKAPNVPTTCIYSTPTPGLSCGACLVCNNYIGGCIPTMTANMDCSPSCTQHCQILSSTTAACRAGAPPAGSACDDGNQCTVGDQCDGLAGGCVGGAPRACSDGSPCTADGCDPATGCTSTALPDGLHRDAADASCQAQLGAAACMVCSCAAGAITACACESPCLH